MNGVTGGLLIKLTSPGFGPSGSAEAAELGFRRGEVKLPDLTVRQGGDSARCGGSN